MTQKAFIPALAFAAALAVSAPAAAQDFVFGFMPHELETSGGRASLYDRLSASVERYCEAPGRRGLWRKRANAECASALVDNMIVEIGDPRVAAIHAERSRFASN